jgi:hypothetical protein
MKTLVIHPDDRSTDFLKLIYEGKDWTIINDHNVCRSRKQITELIKSHDRIIMMGHGYPGGLFFTCIDSGMVYLLREKFCVCIWCNADQFVNKYKLTGFFTGMFISEVGEAFANGIDAVNGVPVLQDEITYSNVLFAMELNKVIDEPNVHSLIKESYKGVFENDVIRFNNDRLYYRGIDDTDSLERDLANRDLEDELRFFDDLDPAGGRGLNSHI